MVKFPKPSLVVTQPLAVRIFHWLNVVAVAVLLMSGWRIFNASPLFDFHFPAAMTLGGWLGGALQWHFAAIWLLTLNGIVYLAYNLLSGRFKSRFWPLSLSGALRDVAQALQGRLPHDALDRYNMAQRFMYLGVMVVLALLVASGLVIWKPVQFPLLRSLMGDYEMARWVHFVAMVLLVAFVLVHVAMVLLVPKTLAGMVGWPLRLKGGRHV